MSEDALRKFVRESNRIEGIRRPPAVAEVEAHRRFLALPEVTLEELERFVLTIAPGKFLRAATGMNVRVGRHYPPPGGVDIVLDLYELLGEVNANRLTPYQAHVKYEFLHPFMDGNGRSGRVLWLWMLSGHAPLGFLHTFYYQALDDAR